MGVEVYLHSFITSALDTDEWSTSCPSCFTCGKKTPLPLNRRFGRPESKVGCQGEVKILLSKDSNLGFSSP